MHIAPFHFMSKNAAGEQDFLGYLVYKPSRRNKQKLRVYFNVGAGNDFVTELDVTIDMDPDTPPDVAAWFEYDYYEMFAQYLEMHEYDLEYFGESLPGQDRNQNYLRQWMQARGADLRFW